MLPRTRSEKRSPCTKRRFSALEFDPSGKYLATGDDAGACFVWDLSREKPLARPVTEKNQVKALAFLHGASQLLTAYADGQIEVSECASGLVTAKYRLPRGRRITSGAISPGPETLRCRHGRRAHRRHRSDRAGPSRPD